MTKQEFKKWLTEGPVYLDGATGSNLMKNGMPAGVCPEEWILEHSDVLLSLQENYVEAGTNILYAPTFTANRIKLAEYGIEDRVREINHSLVAISKKAADGKAFVAGDLTMTGEQLAPMGKMDFEELISIYKEQIAALVEAGVDLLVVETMMSLQETRAALIAAKEVCADLPIMATVTFESDGRTLYGTDATTAAVVMESLGADAIGANCSTGPAQMSRIIKSMAEVTSVPVIAKPNAGMPEVNAEGKTVYSMAPAEFAEEMKLTVEAGASVLGGCCGTDPEYIRELKKSTREMHVDRERKGPGRYLSSERQTLEISLDDNFIVIGERINPTGKKKLQEEIRNGNFETILNFAEQQESCGARILDVNVGMSGIDEQAVMLRALEEVANVSSLPLSIDTSNTEVMEQALRRYPGRALINSISLETVKYEKLLPIAKKYGAMFILLPLSDEGLPKNLEEKKHIIHTIMDRAIELGMKKEDIVVDGLVTTVGANKTAARETLDTIRYCKNIGLATACGLSNISFGLPERGYVNAAFLVMAIQAGLTMAIANPNQELLMCSALASDLLLNRTNADIRYIEQINKINEGKQEVGGNTNQTGHAPVETLHEKLYKAVLKGQGQAALELTQKAISEGTSPNQILNETLLPAINEVGELFDKGKYFLPQLISSAEAMKGAIEYMEPLLLKKNDQEVVNTVVIATVKGDIHDIGKNLVALMLKNHGFRVLDLGKDVPKEEIVRVAMEEKANIIALSALMTTTMCEMKSVIELAREQGVTARIIIGGAVITEDYAKEIGADGYSRDAADAVKLVKNLLHVE